MCGRVSSAVFPQVTHVEPWEKGSRKTAGQTGMCGGVSRSTSLLTSFPKRKLRDLPTKATIRCNLCDWFPLCFTGTPGWFSVLFYLLTNQHQVFSILWPKIVQVVFTVTVCYFCSCLRVLLVVLQVRGVGTGGIVSTAFCLLYKLFTLKLTRKQVMGLITHTDSPYIRALGFMYIR